MNYPHNTQSENVKTAILIAGPCTLGGYYIDNTEGAAVYVQFFNAAAASDVTIGTTTPIWEHEIPNGNHVHVYLDRGLTFDLGLVIAATDDHWGSSAVGNGVDVGTVYA